MRRIAAALLAGACLLAIATPAASAVESDVVCRFSDARLTEISGMAPSLRHPGILWLHNDSSGGARLYAVSASSCKTVATLTIRGAKARDYEAVATGRDAKGRPVIWLGDIGDNQDSWKNVEVLRIREPKTLSNATVSAKTYRFTYPDRPHNAEALMAGPNSPRLWVITKQLAHGSLYALPTPLSASRTNIARRLRTEGGLVTDAAVSPNGRLYVVRDYFDAYVYRGLPPGTELTRIALPGQVQGEAICWAPDGRSLLIASERDTRLLRVALPSSVLAAA